MEATLDIGEVKIRLVDETPDGLLGWASCVLNGCVFLNNIAIRRATTGEIHLTYPHTRSRSEQRYFLFNPITQEASQAFERAILGRLPRGTR